MKFACYTLGCKVNQYETQAMEQLLMQSGHTLGSFDEICDGYIINTCTVTAVSDKKSRNAIRRVRKLNPAAAVGAVDRAQRAPLIKAVHETYLRHKAPPAVSFF